MPVASLIFSGQLVISLFSPPASIGLITSVPFRSCLHQYKAFLCKGSAVWLTLASACIQASGQWLESGCTSDWLSGLSRWPLVCLQSAYDFYQANSVDNQSKVGVIMSCWVSDIKAPFSFKTCSEQESSLSLATSRMHKCGHKQEEHSPVYICFSFYGYMNIDQQQILFWGVLTLFFHRAKKESREMDYPTVVMYISIAFILFWQVECYLLSLLLFHCNLLLLID